MKQIELIDGIEDLTVLEQKETNGGIAIAGAIGLGLGILFGVCLLAAGAGYAYGKYVKGEWFSWL